jgi:hypothetical protein
VWVLAATTATLLLWGTDARCLNDCSQHGLCSGPGPEGYCICEGGFLQDDCSQRLCPKGDDPMTTDQEYRQISIMTGAMEGYLSGHFDFTFMGHTVGLEANADAQACKYALEALPTVASVDCERGAVDSQGGATYTVTFLEWPVYPQDNNLFSHDGNPPLSYFSCSADSVEGADFPACAIDDVGERFNIREYDLCSNHGECNEASGDCKCSRGWRGPACDDNMDAADTEFLYAEGPFFSGALSRLRAHRGTSDDYSFLRAEAGDGKTPVLTLAGSGDLFLHQGDLSVDRGSLVVADGDVEVEEGDLRIGNGALEVVASAASHGLAVALAEGGTDGGFAHGALLSVSAPEAESVRFGGAGAFDSFGDSGSLLGKDLSSSFFDYVLVGPNRSDASELTSARDRAEARRADGFFRIDQLGTAHFGGRVGRGGVHVREGDLAVGTGNLNVSRGDGVFGGAVRVFGRGGASVENGPLAVRNGNGLVQSPSRTQPALAVLAAPAPLPPSAAAERRARVRARARRCCARAGATRRAARARRRGTSRGRSIRSSSPRRSSSRWARTGRCSWGAAAWTWSPAAWTCAAAGCAWRAAAWRSTAA